MTRPSDGHLDDTASEALDAHIDQGDEAELTEPVRSRMAEMADIRAMLRDDTDAPTSVEMDAILSEALEVAAADGPIAEASPRTTVGTAVQAPASPDSSGRRNPVPWLAAVAAAVVVVVSLSVMASGRLTTESADEAATAPADSAGSSDSQDSADAVEAETDADVEEFSAQESTDDADQGFAGPPEGAAGEATAEPGSPREAPAAEDAAPTGGTERAAPGPVAAAFAGVRVVITIPLG